MRFRITWKKVAVAAVVPAVAASGIVAYAFWTTGGHGSGNAVGGVPTSNLTVNGVVDPPPLVLNGSPQNVSLTVTNPNNYSVDLKGDAVSLVPGTLKCGSTAVPDAWINVGGVITSPTTVPAAGSAPLSNLSGVTASLVDDPSADQDVCQGAPIAFQLSVHSETGF